MINFILFFLLTIQPQTNYQNMTTIEKNYDNTYWLALNLYHEARGENLFGQMAVNFVVMNRTQDSRWPDTIENVVNQKWQFSWTFDGRPDKPRNMKSWNKCWNVAELSIELYNSMIENHGDWLTKGSNHYHSIQMRKYPSWASKMEVKGVIGKHVFYKG